MSADIETLLYSGMTGYAGLSALISTRLYPIEAEGGAAFPHVVYQRVSSPKELAVTGLVAGALTRFQFTIRAATYASLRAVAVQVKAALLALSTGVVTIYGVYVENEIDLERTPGASTWARVIDAQILHSE